MKITKYGIDDLKKARELQKQCINLHLPCPPVIHWKAEVTNDKNEILELVTAKANSYVRNALNFIAWTAGLASTTINTSTFGDGSISLKSTAGAITTTLSRGSGTTPKIVLGNDSPPSAESLNTFALDGMTAGLTQLSNNVISNFDIATRKLVTLINTQFSNTTTDKNITSSIVTLYTGNDYVFIRDIFPAIYLPIGANISFSYVTEVLFPNP